MESGVSMRATHEITRKFAKQYSAATKGAKGTLLDEVCAITGWSRDNARRQSLNTGPLPRTEYKSPHPPHVMGVSKPRQVTCILERRASCAPER